VAKLLTNAELKYACRTHGDKAHAAHFPTPRGRPNLLECFATENSGCYAFNDRHGRVTQPQQQNASYCTAVTLER
jgi:hypothetical protein